MQLLGIYGRKEYYLTEAKDEKLGYLPGKIIWRVPDIRESVRAPKGYKLFSADYSQIEVKIMAWLSGDPFLKAAINSGKDIHCYMVAEVFNLDYDLVNTARKDKKHPQHDEMSTLRSNIKTTTFGIPYGAGVGRVAMMTGMTEEAAEAFIKQYFKKASVLEQWLERIRKEAVSERSSRTAKGRVRWYDVPPRVDTNYKKIVSQIGRYAGNMPIQGGCADLLKEALVNFYLSVRDGSWTANPIWDARILLAVHDEIVAMAKEEFCGTSENPGPAPLMLLKAMEDSYNNMSTTVREYDALEEKWVSRPMFLNELKNKIDVVVGDFWSKE